MCVCVLTNKEIIRTECEIVTKNAKNDLLIIENISSGNVRIFMQGLSLGGAIGWGFQTLPPWMLPPPLIGKGWAL